MLNASERSNVILDIRTFRLIEIASTIALVSSAILVQPVSAASKFETASVKSNTTGGQNGAVQIIPARDGGPSGTFDHLSGTNVTLKQLVQFSFGLLDSEIFGPPWIDGEGYDIAAQPAAPVSSDEMRAMLRKVLADRFHLEAHRETRVIPIYWLTIAEGGPKLRSPDEEKAFFAALGGKSPFRPGFGGMYTTKDLPGFAERLSRGIGRAVVDETGIKGRYWFQIEWVSAEPSRGIASPALLSALKEQAGLKLEEHQAPAKVLIVDSAERPADK